MKLTATRVQAVADEVKAATGREWLSHFSGDVGSGTRYVMHSAEIYFGGPGAASVLSYLAGVAAVYSVTLEGAEEVGVLDYLRSSGRFDTEAEERGKGAAETYVGEGRPMRRR